MSGMVGLALNVKSVTINTDDDARVRMQAVLNGRCVCAGECIHVCVCVCACVCV